MEGPGGRVIMKPKYVMKAINYPVWETLELCKKPVPKPAEHEVLLKVSACGICGSELESFKNRNPRRRPPVIMGHEFCGVVVETGKAVERNRIGERVVSHSIVPCRKCKSCERGNAHLCSARQVFGMHRQGAFAEFVNVPEHCLIDWPEQLPSELACLAEPLANGLHVVNLLGFEIPETLLIFGAGPIGLMCQQAAKIKLGARIIVVDLIDERLAIASALGAHGVVNPGHGDIRDAVHNLTNGEGIDAVIDAVGSEKTKTQSLQFLRPGGTAVWIGLHGDPMHLNSYDITLAEKKVFGSYAASFAELEEAVTLLSSDKIDARSWVQICDLNNGVQAFHRMLAAKKSDIKAVIVP